MNSTGKKMRKFISYLKRTIVNKLCAIALVVMGLISTKIGDDSNFLVFAIIFGVILFTAKDDCMMFGKNES